jgi:hypothetical protein
MGVSRAGTRRDAVTDALQAPDCPERGRTFFAEDPDQTPADFSTPSQPGAVAPAAEQGVYLICEACPRGVAAKMWPRASAAAGTFKALLYRNLIGLYKVRAGWNGEAAGARWHGDLARLFKPA